VLITFTISCKTAEFLERRCMLEDALIIAGISSTFDLWSKSCQLIMIS
jgi:hypothetical protein